MNNRFGTASSLLVFLCLAMVPGIAWANYLGGITFDKEIPSFLPHNESVLIDIDYKIDQAEGARIFARPYTLGSPTPGYGASGSPLYPAGTGTAHQSFQIFSGTPVVTHIRVTMVSADQSETYLELFVPVRFIFGPTGVFNITTDHTEYSRLPYNKPLNINFDYATNQPETVRIFARPFTEGSVSPGYSASGSGELSPAGSYAQFFQFPMDADVTDIRFQFVRVSDNTVLDEIFIPFDIHWREVGIYDMTFDWAQGEQLHNSQDIIATFTVEHNSAETRYTWAWCTTGGLYSPGGVYQASAPVPAGPQTITRYFRVNDGEQMVDGVRFTYGTASQQLMHFIVPVDYDFAPHAIQNVAFTPRSPAILSNGEHLNLTFDYMTSHLDPVRVFARPAYEEELLYGMTSAGSPAYPVPSGSGTFWMTYPEGDHLANSVYMVMRDLDQTQDLGSRFVPGWFVWGATGQITPVPDLLPDLSPALASPYPNPFNPVTSIPVHLGRASAVDLAVYDLKGRLVSTLHHGILSAGRHDFTFQADQQASGIYFARLKTPAGVQTKPMMLVK